MSAANRTAKYSGTFSSARSGDRIERLIKTMLAVVLFCLSTPASAQSLTQADNAELAAVVDQFYEDMTTLNFDGVVKAMPPSVLSDLARRNSIDEGTLKAAAINQLETAMASVTIVDMEIDIFTAILGETSTGRIFVLLPTRTDMKVGESVYRASSHTLAFKEDEYWYVMRIDNPSEPQVLVNALPEFATVTFPEEHLEQLE